ncbi:MAG: Crp/Fnr family transcriptional regulator [Mycobacterium sp.]|nr:MAG: Crp/Fnr family transcriptional regulator [Mycobacterium sp.]
MDAEKLASIGLFSDLGPDVLDQLLAQSSTLRLVRGDVIFSEGSTADSLYIVESGRIAIGNKSFDGRESMVALMTEGDLFGEMSLFDELGRSAEARALEPSMVVSIPYQPLIDLWRAQPELLWRVVGLLSQRLRNMDEALADSFLLDVTGRTAKHLLEMAGDRDEFEIPITQEELAGLVGASRERVNKAISSFVRLGWLQQNDRTYRIINRRELEIRSM